MNCLDNYLKIYEQFPLKDKRFKKERNIALNQWKIDENDYSLLKDEVCIFIKEHSDIINSVFIKRVVCPLFEECFNKNEYNFVSELIETITINETQKISVKDIINIFCEYKQWKQTPIQIVNKLLSRINSEILLQLKFDLMQEQIYYSIHELPLGILDINISSKQSYIEFLNEFEETAKKLNTKIDIDNIKTLYNAYFDYSENKNECSFEDYLEQHKIDYNFLFYQKP